MVNFVYGLLHELRCIVHDPVFQTGWERRAQVFHPLPNPFRGSQRVRARQLKDAKGDGGFTVKAGGHAVILGAQLDLSNVSQKHELAAASLFDDNLLKLIGGDQSAQRIDGQRKGRSFWGRRCSQLTRGHLHVLGLNRSDNICDSEPASVHPVWIQPDPHTIVAFTEDLDIANAIHS